MSNTKKELNKIKSGLFQRGFSLAKISLQSGSQFASHSLSQLFYNEEEKVEKWKSFLMSQAGLLSHELGELKGSLMKAGQMLSMYGEYFLPDEANKFLKSLYFQSPPLKWNEIEKILKTQLTTEQLDQLEIDPVSIGSASLGQVHRAQIKKTGEWIAIKIQYPGVDKAIDSDLKALKIMLSMMKILPRDIPIDSLFLEIRNMLIQEIDYKSEALETEKYRLRLSNDSRFVVPRVYFEFSTEKILATSLEAGVSPDDEIIRNLSLSERNYIGENFLDLYMKEFFDWGVVQTDPHLGNYKIRLHPTGKHQIVLLDFGAIRNYSTSFLTSYKKMILSTLKEDFKGVQDASLDLKFLQGSEDKKIKDDFYELCRLTVEPFLGQVYNYKNSDLPQRLTQQVFKIVTSFKVSPPPSEAIFLDRKTGGVFIFLSVLECEFNPRPLLDKYLF